MNNRIALAILLFLLNWNIAAASDPVAEIYERFREIDDKTEHLYPVPTYIAAAEIIHLILNLKLPKSWQEGEDNSKALNSIQQQYEARPPTQTEFDDGFMDNLKSIFVKACARVKTLEHAMETEDYSFAYFLADPHNNEKDPNYYSFRFYKDRDLINFPHFKDDLDNISKHQSVSFKEYQDNFRSVKEYYDIEALVEKAKAKLSVEKAKAKSSNTKSILAKHIKRALALKDYGEKLFNVMKILREIQLNENIDFATVDTADRYGEGELSKIKARYVKQFARIIDPKYQYNLNTTKANIYGAFIKTIVKQSWGYEVGDGKKIWNRTAYRFEHLPNKTSIQSDIARIAKHKTKGEKDTVFNFSFYGSGNYYDAPDILSIPKEITFSDGAVLEYANLFSRPYRPLTHG